VLKEGCGGTDGNSDVCCRKRYDLLQGSGRRREIVMCAVINF